MDGFADNALKSAIGSLALPAACAAAYPFVFGLLTLRLRRWHADYSSRKFFRYVATVSLTRTYVAVGVFAFSFWISLFVSVVTYGYFKPTFDQLGPDTVGWLLFTTWFLPPLSLVTWWLWRHEDAQSPGFGTSGKTSWLLRKCLSRQAPLTNPVRRTHGEADGLVSP